MNETLKGCRVLVVEDEYILADELRVELEYAEAIVIGPVGHLVAAMELIETEAEIHGAVVDVNLGGDNVFPAVDLLDARGIPMIFATGYDASTIPARYAHIVKYRKPLTSVELAKAIGRLLK